MISIRIHIHTSLKSRPKGDGDRLCQAVEQITLRKKEMEAACVSRAAQFCASNTFQAYLELYKELCS